MSLWNEPIKTYETVTRPISEQTQGTNILLSFADIHVFPLRVLCIFLLFMSFIYPHLMSVSILFIDVLLYFCSVICILFWDDYMRNTFE